MGVHRKDIILVLDEIHMACKNGESIADQLKTFLDEGGDFPHVIGITTDEEYENHIKENAAFSLRFDRVDIENCNRDECMSILSDTVLKSRSKPFLTPDALSEIYEATVDDDSPQPAASLKLLKKCINRTEKTQKTVTEKKIIAIANKIFALRSVAAASGSSNHYEEISKLEKELRKLKLGLQKTRKETQQLFEWKGVLDRARRESYQTVLKIGQVAKSLKADPKQLKQFALLQHFLIPFLEANVKSKAKDLGIHLEIDKALIEQME